MSQSTIILPTSGIVTATEFAEDANAALQNIASLSSGATDPSTLSGGVPACSWWADTDSHQLKQRNEANNAWIIRASLLDTTIIQRSDNTILTSINYNFTILASGTFSQTIDAAATLGNGWYVKYKNIGSGVITIDPNGTELIDGQNTLKLYPGDGCFIISTGDTLQSVGLPKSARTSFTVLDDTSSLYFGQNDGISNRIESAGRNLKIIQSGLTNTLSLNHNNVGDLLIAEAGGRIQMPYQPAFDVAGTGTQVWSTTPSSQILNLTIQKGGIPTARNSHYNTTLKRFTAPVSGVYAFYHGFTLTGSGSGPEALLYINGASGYRMASIGYISSAGYFTTTGFQVTYLNQNDYVDIRVNNNNSAAFTIDLGRAYFGGYLIG